MNPASPQLDIAGPMSAAPSLPLHYTGDKVQTESLKPSPPPQATLDSQLHSTASTPRKRPHLDNLLNPSPLSDSQDLSLPSINVQQSTSEAGPSQTSNTLHNTLSLVLSPLSQSTVFDHSPAHSTVSMPDVERSGDQPYFKSFPLKPLGRPAVPSPEAEEQDELYEDEDDLHIMAAGPSHQASYPPRASVSPTPSVEPQGPLPPQPPQVSTASPPRLIRPMPKSLHRVKHRSKAGSPRGSPQQGGSELAEVDGDVDMGGEGRRKYPCGYVSPMGNVPPCTAQIGKGADLTRHMNEIHGVAEARAVESGSLILGLAKRYLADLSSLIKHNVDETEPNTREHAELAIQATIVSRAITHDDKPFDFDHYEVPLFRDVATTRAAMHRRYFCHEESCKLEYGSERSLTRHMRDNKHGVYKDLEGDTGRKRAKKLKTPPAESLDARAEKKTRKAPPFGGRMDWKTNPQEATGPTIVQAAFVDRRLSIFGPKTVKEEDVGPRSS